MSFVTVQAHESIKYTDLWVFKGSSLTILFKALNESGGIYDLTGWHVRFVSCDVTKTSENPDQIILTDILNGEGKVFIKPQNFMSIYDGATWRLELFNTQDEIYPFVIGKVRFLDSPH